MSSFFHQQAQIMMSKHIDNYPLLKIRLTRLAADSPIRNWNAVWLPVWISTSSAVLTMSPYPTTAPSAVSAIGWHRMTP